MSKKFTYLNTKTQKVIYETTEPNYISLDDVDKKVLKKTKIDPRFTPHIERQIRVV